MVLMLMRAMEMVAFGSRVRLRLPVPVGREAKHFRRSGAAKSGFTLPRIESHSEKTATRSTPIHSNRLRYQCLGLLLLCYITLRSCLENLETL